MNCKDANRSLRLSINVVSSQQPSVCNTHSVNHSSNQSATHTASQSLCDTCYHSVSHSSNQSATHTVSITAAISLQHTERHSHSVIHAMMLHHLNDSQHDTLIYNQTETPYSFNNQSYIQTPPTQFCCTALNDVIGYVILH